jgi:hypothetical protein
MAKRLLPFRQVDEYDVLGIYCLSTGYCNNATTDSGNGDDGVFVKVNAGDLNKDPFEFTTWSHLGKTNYPWVGHNQYNVSPLNVVPAYSGDVGCLGVTLMETAMYDENGEKLIYNKVKKDQLYVASPGQTVPIATRGVLTLSSAAFDGTLTVGNGFKLSATSGKVTGCTVTDTARLGLVLGTGSRTSLNGITDAFNGNYAVVGLGL